MLKQGWTQEALARNEGGWTTSPHHPQARSWCIQGALFKVTGENDIETCENPVCDNVADLLVNYLKAPIEEWNDESGRTQEEAVSALEEVLKLEESKP